MSSPVTFKLMLNHGDHQFQLAKELCNWDNFRGSLLELPTDILETPFYYFDSSNTKHTIMDSSSFDAMVLDSGNNAQDNIIHLYVDNNAPGPATATTTSEWVFAPEEDTLDGAQRSTLPDTNDGTSFSDRLSTCFRQLGQVIDKHGRLIESNPYLRILIRQFASSIAMSPDADMISRLDQWLASQNNNINNNDCDTSAAATNKDSKEHKRQHKHRHGCRRGKERAQRSGGRRDIFDSLPEDLAHFVMPNRHDRHHHHHDISSLWGSGMHKHKHHHQEHQPPPYGFIFGAGPSSVFDLISGTGPLGGHLFFGGRHGKHSIKCSRADRHFEKAMKHHHRHRRCPYFFDAPTDSSSSSSSDMTSSSSSSSSSSSESEDDTNGQQKEAGSKRQQKKLWKTMANEHIHRGRRDLHSHHGIHGPERFYDYGRYPAAPPPFLAGCPPLVGHAHPPHPYRPAFPPGYIEQSFGQMHLNDSKDQ